MTQIRNYLKPYKDAGAANSVIPIHRFVDEHAFLTKSGSVGVALSLEGISRDCLTDQMLESISTRLRSTLAALEDCRIYQYLIKHDGAHLPPSDHEAARERNVGLESRGLYSVDLFLVILYEPEAFGKLKPTLSNRKVLRILADQLKRDIERLKRKTEAFVRDTAVLLHARILPKAEAFTFLRTLVNLDPDSAWSTPLVHDSHVDYFLPSEPIGVYRDGIQIGNEHIEILTLKEPPRQTKPDFSRELCSMKANFIACTEYKPISKHEAVQQIQKAENHFNRLSWLKNPWSMVTIVLNKLLGEDNDRRDIVSDKAALSDVEELGKISLALNQGDVLGQFSTTIVFHGPDRRELQEHATKAVSLLSQFEAAAFRETYNALNAYLGILPGNTAFNMRTLWLLGSSYADMALMFAAGRGERQNKYLGSEYLLICETEDQTPYYLNLHHEDVFGVLVTGKTGSGKSVLSNACLDQLQKYDPITLILDIGGSYKQLCRRYDGSYMHLGRLDFKINPFLLPDSASNKRFLSAFLRLLLTNEGYAVTFGDKSNIFDAVCELYTRPEDQRRLSSLQLSEHLWAPLQRWTRGGEYGSIFDNAEDTVTFSHLKVMDFQGIEEVQEITEPLFFYLFGRFDSLVKDPNRIPTLKNLWADEVWRFLQNSTARQFLVSAGKTWRKHKGGIGLATQSAFDLKNTGVLEIINEVTPTKLLLANPSADLDAYRQIFHFNDTEVEKFRGLIAKRQFMLKREEQPTQVLNLTLTPLELARYGNDPMLNARRDAAIAEHGYEEGLAAVAAIGGSK